MLRIYLTSPQLRTVDVGELALRLGKRGLGLMVHSNLEKHEFVVLVEELKLDAVNLYLYQIRGEDGYAIYVTHPHLLRIIDGVVSFCDGLHIDEER
jgi:hypothetical protein